MPQVGTVNFTGTFTPSMSADVVRHRGRIRAIDPNFWADADPATIDIGPKDTADATTAEISYVLPVMDVAVNFVHEVEAIDAADPTEMHSGFQESDVFTVPAGDPAPEKPTNVGGFFT